VFGIYKGVGSDYGSREDRWVHIYQLTIRRGGERAVYPTGSVEDLICGGGNLLLGSCWVNCLLQR
jgi:hypothetical protein